VSVDESPERTPVAPSPVLGYATPGDEVFHPQAEALVHANAPPNAIRRFFRKPRLALQYYVRAKQRQFDPAAAGGACAACGGGAEGDGLVAVWWHVRMPPRFASFRLRVRAGDEQQAFATLHPMCVACETAWLRRVRWPAVAIRAGTWVGGLTLVAWLAAVAAGVLGVRVPGHHVGFLVFIGVMLTGSLVRLVLEHVIARATPAGMRRLMPRQVRCHGPAARLTSDNINAGAAAVVLAPDAASRE